MSRFREFANAHELKDLYLHGRMYTWSNGRQVPTMTRIDRALASVEWDLNNPDSVLQALSSNVSDHTPLHLSLNASFRPKRRFKFEVFWTKLEGFEEAVKEGWVCDPAIVDPFLKLDTLLRNTAKHLQSWGQRKIGNVKVQLALANSVTHRLEVAQENRILSPGEYWLKGMLKHAVLALSSLERTIARQRSRMNWLRDGDANTKLFHVVANGRRTRNFIPAITVNGEVITDQKRKEEAFHDAYQNLLGTILTREHTIDLDSLELPHADLQDLDRIDRKSVV